MSVNPLRTVSSQLKTCSAGPPFLPYYAGCIAPCDRSIYPRSRRNPSLSVGFTCARYSEILSLEAEAMARKLPPALIGCSDMMWTCSWQLLGGMTTVTGEAFFCDLSVVCWPVIWDTTLKRQPDFVSHTKRRARYLDNPRPLQPEVLWHASSA